MYGDRRSAEFIEAMRSFLKVAEANKRNCFICFPCGAYRNEKDYSYSSTIHFHLIRWGFLSGYNCWTKHGERGVMMEDGEEEENDDNYHHMFPEYSNTAMEDSEVEEGGHARASLEPTDGPGWVISDAK
jgi:hypothetical protein